MDGEHNDQRKQREHHDLADALESVLQAERADQEARDNDQLRPERHLTGVREHRAEFADNGFGIHPGMERAGEEFAEIVDHPAGDGGIVHHEQEAANQAEPAVDVPFLAGFFKVFVRQDGTLFAGAAHGQLHRQHRHAHDEQADQIDEDEKAAAVLAGDIREAPDVADADGAAGADEQEAQSGTE